MNNHTNYTKMSRTSNQTTNDIIIRCPRGKRLTKLLLYIILIIGSFGLLSQIITVSYRIGKLYEQNRKINNMHTRVFAANENEDIGSHESKTTYLSYKTNFSFPLDINIADLIEQRLSENISIPHAQINPHPFVYIHKPESCNFELNGTSLKQKDTILILVKSAAKNHLLRSAVRVLWKFVNDPGIRKVFMLGYNDIINQSKIDNESRIHQDIIQENFIDAYRNNTYKTIMGFNWAARFCSQAQFLFFMDDDHYLKLKELADYLRKMKRKNGLYLGTVSNEGIPYRDPSTPWFISSEEYPFDKYPPYVGGGAYVVSVDIARRFQLAFPYVKYIPIDDAYLGIVAKKLHIFPRPDKNFAWYYKGAIARECSHEAEELIKHECPIPSSHFTAYIHPIKKPKHDKRIIIIFVTILFIFFVIGTCLVLPGILYIFCDSYLKRTSRLSAKKLQT